MYTYTHTLDYAACPYSLRALLAAKPARRLLPEYARALKIPIRQYVIRYNTPEQLYYHAIQHNIM